MQQTKKKHGLLYFQAVDAVYFNGTNKEGYYFVGATARRHEKLTQTLLYIRVCCHKMLPCKIDFNHMVLMLQFFLMLHVLIKFYTLHS